MDMMRWLMKAKRWSQKPPSARQVITVLTIVAICLVIVGIEWLGLWPEWARVEKLRLGRP